MKVFSSPEFSGEVVWHLVVSYSWEKSSEFRETVQFNQLMVLRVQFFCEDVGHPRYNSTKFTMVEYNREKHLKKLCEACVLKAKKSKRYGPQVSQESSG